MRTARKFLLVLVCIAVTFAGGQCAMACITQPCHDRPAGELPCHQKQTPAHSQCGDPVFNAALDKRAHIAIAAPALPLNRFLVNPVFTTAPVARFSVLRSQPAVPFIPTVLRV